MSIETNQYAKHCTVVEVYVCIGYCILVTEKYVVNYANALA